MAGTYKKKAWPLFLYIKEGLLSFSLLSLQLYIEQLSRLLLQQETVYSAFAREDANIAPLKMCFLVGWHTAWDARPARTASGIPLVRTMVNRLINIGRSFGQVRRHGCLKNRNIPERTPKY